MSEVCCFGEALVDLLPDRRGKLRDCARFEVRSGGAPANVAVGLARQGVKAAFVGVVGEDEFGHLLAQRLAAEGIDVRLRFSSEAKTGVWFVALDEQGDRTFFTPTGAGSADKLIAPEDCARLPAEARWLHCGSSSHIRPEAQEALKLAVREARARGQRVSFDPNVRAHLWDDLRELRALCAAVLPLCTVVKLSEDETEACLGERDPGRALDALHALGVDLACVTLGARGAIARRGSDRLTIPAPQVAVVDTTGAGDAFVAGLLARLDRDPLETALRHACSEGSRICTQLGAT